MNLSEGKWKDAGGGIQLYILLMLWFFGIMMGASILNLMLGDGIQSSATSVRIANSINSICLFLFPVTIYGILFADTKGKFLSSSGLLSKILILALLAIVCIQPFIHTVNYFNEFITLPENLSSVQEFLDKAKESGAKSATLILADKSIGSLTINLLVMAILPGIVEELFFRGCMQRTVFKMSGNTHVSIWVTAIIFSLMHLSLSGLILRIILGALLGYLYVWSKNILVPILVHITYNALIIILSQILSNTPFYRAITISDSNIKAASIVAVISLILTAFILLFAYKNRVKEDSQ